MRPLFNAATTDDVQIHAGRFHNGGGDSWSWMPRYTGNNPVYSVHHRFVKFVVLGCVMAAITATALADNPAATINVNANANRHAISPLIYGANWTDQASLSDLNLSVNRRGGNATSTYNWQINAANRAGDWFFESLGESDGSAPSAAPDAFITSTKAGGAQPMITIPMLDWIAKLGPGRSGLTPYSIAKYGPQTGHDPYWSDAGNGIGTNAVTHTTWTIRTNNPNDAYVSNSSAIQQQWVQYLTNKFGNASGNGVKYYVMDNEYGVWPANHRPLMTNGPTMDRIRDLLLDYGAKVKAVDPAAKMVAPEEWGWPNYFSSPYDTSLSGGTDRAAHGGWDYIPWLLDRGQ